MKNLQSMSSRMVTHLGACFSLPFDAIRHPQMVPDSCLSEMAMAEPFALIAFRPPPSLMAGKNCWGLRPFTQHRWSWGQGHGQGDGHSLLEHVDFTSPRVFSTAMRFNRNADIIGCYLPPWFHGNQTSQVGYSPIGAKLTPGLFLF